MQYHVLISRGSLVQHRTPTQWSLAMSKFIFESLTKYVSRIVSSGVPTDTKSDCVRTCLPRLLARRSQREREWGEGGKKEERREGEEELKERGRKKERGRGREGVRVRSREVEQRVRHVHPAPAHELTVGASLPRLFTLIHTYGRAHLLWMRHEL